MAYLFSKDLVEEEARAFVRRVKRKEPCVSIVFYPDRFIFEKSALEKIVLEKSAQGRIFSPESELQWRRMGEKLRLVYLGESLPPEGLENCSKELDQLERETGEFFLWGVLTEKENRWIEQQVPVEFKYPVTENQYPRGRIKLVVEKWIDASGDARFSRYHSLKETKGGV